MMTHSLRRRTAVVAVALVAISLGTLAGCGSAGGSDDASGATTTGASDGGEATSTTSDGDEVTTTAAEASGGGDLTGTWTADAGDIFGANTANLGGVSFECSGPVNLEFRDDGTFSQTSTATCTVQSVSGTATIDSSGSWTADGDQIVVSDATSNGTMEMMGTSQPVDAGMSNGSANYKVDGDTLSITFTVEAVGTVTQVYQRA